MSEKQGGEATKGLLESTCDRKRVALVYNPVSGTEDPKARRARLESLVQSAGLSCGLSETDRERGAAPLAEQALADGMERLLVCGGDGSITEAANVLAGTQVALAVLPGGTGNLLALNLGLPTDSDAAMKAALTGEPRPMDVGRANGTVFLIMAGMGADARMVREADREKKRRLGVLAYFVAAWRHFRRPLNQYCIEVDGQVLRRRAQTVLVANVGKITGGIELVPGADPEDGLLDVAVLRTRGFRDLVGVAMRALFGNVGDHPRVDIIRGRRIIIESPRPLPIEVDGNDVGSTRRLEVNVEPGALRIIRPEAVASSPVAKVQEAVARLLPSPPRVSFGDRLRALFRHRGPAA